MGYIVAFKDASRFFSEKGEVIFFRKEDGQKGWEPMI